MKFTITLVSLIIFITGFGFGYLYKYSLNFESIDLFTKRTYQVVNMYLKGNYEEVKTSEAWFHWVEIEKDGRFKHYLNGSNTNFECIYHKPRIDEL